MLLQRCTNRTRLRRSFARIARASRLWRHGPVGRSSRAGSPGAEAAWRGRVRTRVPPEAQTLYEQATAVMAAGDFVDAELRFKEFVLAVSRLSRGLRQSRDHPCEQRK